MGNRISLLKRKLKEDKVDAFLVSDPANLFYLCGYTGSNGMLIVRNNQSKPIFYTDFRYQEQVKKEVTDCIVKILNRNLYSDFPLSDIKGVKSFGFESNYLSYGNYARVNKQLDRNIKLIPKDSYIQSLREIKDSDELNKIKKAVAITDKVFQNVVTMIKPNITEKDLATEIDYQFTKLCEIAFPTIVAFAERSALPHAQPTNKRLKAGDVIVCDIGAKYQGYCSDMTRTFVFGKASKKVKDVYYIVLNAQQRALDKIKAGKAAYELDGYARNYIKEKGYGDYFGHGLGHAVGIMVHESPTLSSKSTDILKTNQTATVEPGIYLPGQFGIRIEDLVIIKEKGYENLTKTPKELIEL
jgi:Xaa-Pro aminopeptidase